MITDAYPPEAEPAATNPVGTSALESADQAPPQLVQAKLAAIERGALDIEDVAVQEPEGGAEALAATVVAQIISTSDEAVEYPVKQSAGAEPAPEQPTIADGGNGKEPPAEVKPTGGEDDGEQDDKSGCKERQDTEVTDKSESVVIPRELLDEFMRQQEEFQRLQAQVSSLQQRVERLESATKCTTTTSDTKARNIAPESAKTEIPPRLALFSASESASAIPTEALEAQIVFEGKLEDETHKIMAPFTEAIVGEMLTRTPDERKALPPIPSYKEAPEAWAKYVKQHSKDIAWEETQDDTQHSFSISYVPSAQGNRLVGFKTKSRKLQANNQGGNDEYVTDVRLAFDKGQVVEAAFENSMGLSTYTIKKAVVDRSGYEVRMGQKTTVRQLRHYLKGGLMGEKVDQKYYTFTYDRAKYAFVHTPAKEDEPKQAEISGSMHLKLLREMVSCIPTMKA